MISFVPSLYVASTSIPVLSKFSPSVYVVLFGAFETLILESVTGSLFVVYTFKVVFPLSISIAEAKSSHSIFDILSPMPTKDTFF